MEIKFNKDNLIFYTLCIFFIFTIFFIINRTSYLDPFNFCYIKIEGDIVRGDEGTIHKALRLIKKENKKTYIDICKYVDVISEKNCIVADWQISGPEFAAGLNLPGCYARGSKIIYLKPNNTISESIIKNRKDDIIKYGEFSKEFWNNQL